MDDFVPRSGVRYSDTFSTRERSQALTAACIAEAVSELAPEQICVATLLESRAPWVVASRGATLTAEQRAVMHDWARTVTTTSLQVTPSELRRPLKSFRALLAPLASPLGTYGAVLLSSPNANECSREFQRQMDAVCTDWVLRIEEVARAELRPSQLGRSLIPSRSLAALG